LEEEEDGSDWIVAATAAFTTCGGSCFWWGVEKKKNRPPVFSGVVSTEMGVVSTGLSATLFLLNHPDKGGVVVVVVVVETADGRVKGVTNAFDTATAMAETSTMERNLMIE
jgi:hypothetical protein